MSITSTTTRRTANVWVVRYLGRRLAVRVGGETSPVSTYRTQALAIAHGLSLARRRRCELIIQNRGGRIREKNSYGRDPYPPKG